SWTSGVQGIGYDTGDGNYLPLISTDITSIMDNINASAYIRILFTVTDPATYSLLMLRMRYEDGFVAYLNGTNLVAADNHPGTLPYNASANGNRNETEASQFVSFNISSNLPLLQAGTNVLAIHGLNVNPNSSDFLIEAELTASTPLLSSATYFTNATPNNPNAMGAIGRVADTKFSIDRGFYTSPFQVEITTATPGAEIRYTLDGSKPTATSGFIYSAPIPVGTTTTLRACAHLPGWVPSDIDTHTYLFPADIIMQDGSGLGGVGWSHFGTGDWEIDPDIRNHADPECRVVTNDFLALPSVSVVMNFDEMWGSGGIYISGQGSERACSMEMIYPDGAKGFQKDASIQIVGGSSPNRWKTDKLSMRLKFNPPFSNGDLEFPVFGDDAARSFDTLVLDARLNNVWDYGGGVSPTAQRQRALYVRDQVAADFQNEVGGYAPHGQSIYLYINGLFWGIHTLHERPDDNFVAAYLGGDKDDYDVLKHSSTRVVNGSNTTYLALMNAAQQDLTVCTNYEAVLDRVDEAYKPQTPESEYLHHLGIWRLRKEGNGEVALQRRANWLLRRMMVIQKTR
ncbi:MAG: chitobiase/beta-hexosaminidase C-terminal domain-containing protein, partial [Verrucomicrobiota bacterium]